MSENPIILLICLLLLAFGFFSRISEYKAITAPLVFTFFGLLFGLFTDIGFRQGIEASWVKVIAEITLILVLFKDASTIDVKSLLKERRLPMRLLFIGLPLTMILGIIVAQFLFPDEHLVRLMLMALILSPTDAALGLAVIKSDHVPIKIKQSINVESGLNDGLALPPILICIALLGHDAAHPNNLNYWGLFTLKQFIFGPLVGAGVGWLAGSLVEKSFLKQSMNTAFLRISSFAIAILAYYLAEMIHGNGFISAFFAGLFLGTKDQKVREQLQEFSEAGSQILILFIFLLMGLILVPLSLNFWDISVIAYSLLSITLIRMLPVLISLLGTQLKWSDRLFIAWFGPRGIASLLYLLLVLVELGKKGNEKIIAVISLTVLMSVFLHGISAFPLSKKYIKINSL